MKASLCFVLTLIVLFGCEPDTPVSSSSYETLDEILDGREFAVYQGILTFRDQKSFSNLLEEHSEWDANQRRSWEAEQGFESLYSLYEKAVSEEDAFLLEMVKKYGEDSEVGREVIGYSGFVDKMIAEGVLRISTDGIIDMNVMAHAFGYLVNRDRLVRIGYEIRQYDYRIYKSVAGANYGILGQLGSITKSDDNVYVASINHRIFDNGAGRTADLIGSCESVNGKYKLIVYEGLTRTPQGGSPCPIYSNVFDVTLRSLKKVLGTWQNYQTNWLSVTPHYEMNHYNCDGSYNSFVSNRASNPGVNYVTAPGTWHTYTWNWVSNYDTGPCTNTSPSCVGQPGFLNFRSDVDHRMVGFGYNSTTCDAAP